MLPPTKLSAANGGNAIINVNPAAQSEVPTLSITSVACHEYNCFFDYHPLHQYHEAFCFPQ